MELNRIEKRFLADVLQTDLDAPVRAELRVYDDEFAVIVIPRIDQNGYFKLSYFGTPAHMPESNDGTLSWGNGHIFGVHPVLENAWNNQDVVELELSERPSSVAPFPKIVGPKINTKVLVVKPGHRGELAVNRNQILNEDSILRRVVFSLVDFPDFKRPGHILGEIFREGEEGYESFENALKSLQNRFQASVTINIDRPIQIELHAGTEWEIILTRDAESTRNQVSHSGLITRENGEEFKVEEVDDLLAGLTHFFTFVSCAYRHPTAIIGEDSSGRTVWGQIGKFEMMRRSVNWFNNDSSIAATGYLESLFPKFWDKWRAHPEKLTAIIESHINSKAMQQAGLPKEALATSYSGLELLASVVLNNSKNNIANVCKALDSHSIPHLHLDPSETPKTAQLASNLGKSSSGPRLIYDIRNYVTHPQDRRSNTIKQAYLEQLDDAYSPYFYLNDLCQFYLEYLLLIGLCGWKPQHFRILSERR